MVVDWASVDGMIEVWLDVVSDGLTEEVGVLDVRPKELLDAVEDEAPVDGREEVSELKITLEVVEEKASMSVVGMGSREMPMQPGGGFPSKNTKTPSPEQKLACPLAKRELFHCKAPVSLVVNRVEMGRRLLRT